MNSPDPPVWAVTAPPTWALTMQVEPVPRMSAPGTDPEMLCRQVTVWPTVPKLDRKLPSPR